MASKTKFTYQEWSEFGIEIEDLPQKDFIKVEECGCYFRPNFLCKLAESTAGKFANNVNELVTGDPKAAALGLDVYMQSASIQYKRCQKQKFPLPMIGPRFGSKLAGQHSTRPGRTWMSA